MSTVTQFLTDANGERIAAVIPIDEYEELLEDLNDLAMVAERRNESRVSLEEVEIRRSDELLLEDDDVSSALQDGRSLDQLNLRGGDRIIIPAEGKSIWPTVIRWGAVIASTTLLGVRIFY